MKINKKVAGVVFVGVLLVIFISVMYIRDSQWREYIIDLPDVDAVPTISKAQAIETVKDFLGSEAIKSRGYERCRVLGLKLTIAEPNYDANRDCRLLSKGEPTLVWHMCIRDRCRYRFDVIVDAQTGSIAGLVRYK